MANAPKKKSSFWGVVIVGLLVLTVIFCWPEEEQSPVANTNPVTTTTTDGGGYTPVWTTTGRAENSMTTTTTRVTQKVPVTTQRTTRTTRATQADRLPGLSAEYDRHLLLGCRNYGACRTMTGKVVLTMVMVDDDGASWTEAALAAYKKEQEETTAKLLADARRYGVQLDISIRYIRCKTTGTVSMTTYNEWSERAIKAAGLGDSSTLIPRLKQQYGAKEAPVLFCVNYEGRSFAIEWNQGDYFEYAVLYSAHADYRHELCHLFGAVDLYAPASIEKAAQKHMPHSIMISSEYGVDSLTAYLMGWTDTVAPDAMALLKETVGITKEQADKENSMQTYTGYVTNQRIGAGYYTGYLKEGVIDGQGKMVWDNGDVYEGGWSYATYHGQGTLVWASGGKYTGDFYKGAMHGYGTFVSASGDVFTGRWENGEYKG